VKTRIGCLAAWIALAGCGPESASVPSTRPSSAVRQPIGATEPTEPTAPPASDPSNGRAVAAELEAARALVSARQYAEALPRFERLVTHEPGNPRIHCETGFVALRADSLDVAAREFAAGIAIFERSLSVTSERRVPFAMCLFNAGVLAERRGERDAAIARFERSIALRPNPTVSRHLASARAMPRESRESRETLLPTPPPVNVRASRRRIAGPGGRTATLVHEDVPHDEGDVEQGCFTDAVVLFDSRAGESRLPIVGACPDTFSVFRDWAHVREPAWVDAGGEWGQVFTVLADHGGIGDSEPDRGLVDGSVTLLFVFAVREGAWIAASIPVHATERADCANDACDDPDSTDDDADGLRAPFEDEYDVEARIANGAVTLAIRRNVGRLEPPEAGEHPLAWLFDQYGSTPR